jgi:3-hydroxyacyl-[acyl-carrier-protein] dehydratase
MYGRELAMVNFDTSPPMEASALVGAVRIRAREPNRILTSFVVDPDEPVLAGHFPGYPILPGVCLVECAHQSATLALADLTAPGRPRLAGIESARFQHPVSPADEVLIEVTVAADESGWRCRARLTVSRDNGSGPVAAALVRLRYETEERDAGDS